MSDFVSKSMAAVGYDRPTEMSHVEEGILRSLRRITRAIDLHSRHLAGSFGLTGPQLVCLRSVGQHEGIPPSGLAKEVELSQATVTGIVDRLEAQRLLVRARDDRDRRRVSLRLTDAGRNLLDRAPSPLQDQFVQRLAQLPEQEQRTIDSTLRKVVDMMGAEALDAAPLLATGPVDATASQLEELLDTSLTQP